MAKYIVTEDCYGFRNSLWEKGQIVEVEAGEKPPAYFRLLTAEPKPAPEKKTTSENLRGAGYVPKSAHSMGSQLLANIKVKGKINSCLRHTRKSTNNQSKKRRSGRKLTEKQKSFIKAYLRMLCGTKAVVEAYPEVKNRNTAGVMAHELLRNPKIKKIVDEQFDHGRGNCACHFVDFEIKE